MNKYEKILKEICNLVSLRKEEYNTIYKEEKEPLIQAIKIIYNDLYKQIDWLFDNIKGDEDNESTSEF